MTRAILVNFHLYQPYGQQYYEPLLDFFLANMRKFSDEYDQVYLLDSNWNVDPRKIDGMKAQIIRTNPSMRYYDCFKQVLPQIKEDLVLFMDNDMVVYKKDIIGNAFYRLGPERMIYTNPVGGGIKLIPYDVISIYDSIGQYKTDKLNGKNKFCPYWFAARKDLLMKYLDVDWGPDMPYCETLGHLTEKMLEDGVKPYEFEEDKSNILFDGTQDGEKGKDLGYYHCRNGSLGAVLLAWKNNDLDQYWKYLKEQPKSETLRLCGWYQIMGGDAVEIAEDLGMNQTEWEDYLRKFRSYHNI